MRKLFALFALLFSLNAFASGVPGKFDYYLLSLSWSPEHCAEVKSDKTQCGTGKHYAFVVHGLWPQYMNNKSYPSSCSKTGPVPDSVAEEVMPIMPSRSLIEHEWEKHGTCSGKSVEDYFGLIKTTFPGVNIPQDFVRPSHQRKTTRPKVRLEFLNANPGLDLVLACKGKYFQEVRICYDKTMSPMACGSETKDSCPAKIVVRPVR